MIEREKFLERWSRKKAEAQREPAADDAPAEPGRAADDQATEPTAAATGRHHAPDPKLPSVTTPKVEFDLASLPSLESITKATDIRAFLAPGVPAELTRAALRRVWAADPAIRDFVGLQENDWDFTKPGAVPGFGDIPQDYDVKKLVAQIFGERDEAAGQAAADQPAVSTAEEQPARIAAQSDTSASPAPAIPNGSGDDVEQPPEAPAPAGASPLGDFVQRDNIIASHNSNPDETPIKPKSRRPHGRALPE